MNAHIRPSPITTDADHWLFAGLRIDAFVATTADEAQRHADYLNSDKCEFSVIRFNAVEGTCRDVTHEYVEEEDDPEWEDISFADWTPRHFNFGDRS